MDWLASNSDGKQAKKRELPASLSVYLNCRQKVMVHLAWDFLLQINPIKEIHHWTAQ